MPWGDRWDFLLVNVPPAAAPMETLPPRSVFRRSTASAPSAMARTANANTSSSPRWLRAPHSSPRSLLYRDRANAPRGKRLALPVEQFFSDVRIQGAPCDFHHRL